MNSTFSFGLIGRIVIALSLVFALLIILNDLTVSSVIQMSLSTTETGPHVDSSILQHKGSFISHLRKPILIYSITAAVLSLVIASFAIHRIVIRPIRHLTNALDDVAHGKPNVRVTLDGATELILMGANFNRMFDTIQQQKQDLESQLAQLEQTTNNLQTTQNDLIRSARLASVGTLASGVAHEIGNPIAGILGLLDALENEQSNHTAQSYRALIRKEITRVDKIIRDLLSYARPNASDQPQQASLAEVLQHVNRLVTMQKNFAHISLELPQNRLSDNPLHSPSDPTSVHAEIPPLAIPSDDLTAIFVNLFLNAAQAISGKGSIRVYWEKVDTNLNNGEALAIHVVDDGPGVSAQIAESIFDPFFTNRKAGGGTGLGLAICMSICERNQARIELYRSADPGAHFRVIIPIWNPLPSTDANMI